MLMAGDSEPTFNKIYSGIMLNGNETYTRHSSEAFIGQEAGEFTNAGVTLIGGYKFTENENTNVNAELRIGRSFFMEDSENFTTTLVSLFVKPEVLVLKSVTIYGVLGGSYLNYAGRNKEGKMGLAFGGGLEARVGKHVKIFIDYTFNTVDLYLPYLEDNVNMDTLGVGVLYEW